MDDLDKLQSAEQELERQSSNDLLQTYVYDTNRGVDLDEARIADEIGVQIVWQHADTPTESSPEDSGVSFDTTENQSIDPGTVHDIAVPDHSTGDKSSNTLYVVNFGTREFSRPPESTWVYRVGDRRGSEADFAERAAESERIYDTTRKAAIGFDPLAGPIETAADLTLLFGEASDDSTAMGTDWDGYRRGLPKADYTDPYPPLAEELPPDTRSETTDGPVVDRALQQSFDNGSFDKQLVNNRQASDGEIQSLDSENSEMAKFDDTKHTNNQNLEFQSDDGNSGDGNDDWNDLSFSADALRQSEMLPNANLSGATLDLDQERRELAGFGEPDAALQYPLQDVDQPQSDLEPPGESGREELEPASGEMPPDAENSGDGNTGDANDDWEGSTENLLQNDLPDADREQEWKVLGNVEPTDPVGDSPLQETERPQNLDPTQGDGTSQLEIERATHELNSPENVDAALYDSFRDGEEKELEALKTEVAFQGFDEYCRDAIADKPDNTDLFLNSETRREAGEIMGVSYDVKGMQGDETIPLVAMNSEFSFDGDSVQCHSDVSQENEFSMLEQAADVSTDAHNDAVEDSGDFGDDLGNQADLGRVNDASEPVDSDRSLTGTESMDTRLDSYEAEIAGSDTEATDATSVDTTFNDPSDDIQSDF